MVVVCDDDIHCCVLQVPVSGEHEPTGDLRHHPRCCEETPGHCLEGTPGEDTLYRGSSVYLVCDALVEVLCIVYVIPAQPVELPLVAQLVRALPRKHTVMG